jgi:hypothetical protein
MGGKLKKGKRFDEDRTPDLVEEMTGKGGGIRRRGARRGTRTGWK